MHADTEVNAGFVDESDEGVKQGGRQTSLYILSDEIEWRKEKKRRFIGKRR